MVLMFIVCPLCSRDWSWSVPMFIFLIFTSGRNRCLMTSATSIARGMDLPRALMLTSFVPLWNRVMQAST